MCVFVLVWLFLYCSMKFTFLKKSVCLFIGVVMTSFLESNSFFKLGISSCKVLVFWFWQHSIFATVLLIFSSMIQILLALLWAIFLSDVLVAFQIVQKLVFSVVLRVYEFVWQWGCFWLDWELRWYNRRHNKYGVRRVGSIRSLAPIALVKSRLHFGRFTLSYNPKFHCVKSPPADLILRPALYC